MLSTSGRSEEKEGASMMGRVLCIRGIHILYSFSHRWRDPLELQYRFWHEGVAVGAGDPSHRI